MENESSKSAAETKRLWFEDGFWRFKCPHTGDTRVISSLMRETRYDVRSLSKALGLGNRTFRRIAKDSLDISPGAWLRAERAVEMRHRLRSGMSIKELAIKLGFKHQGDFSVEFRRWYEMSPSRFLAEARRRSPET